MRVKGFPYEYFYGKNDKGEEVETFKNDNFVRTFLIGKRSFLNKNRNDNPIFSENDVDIVIDAIKEYTPKIANYTSENKGKKKDEKSEKPKMDLNETQKDILAHAVWLCVYPLDQTFNGNWSYYNCGDYTLRNDIIDTEKGLSSTVANQKIANVPAILNFFKEVIEKDAKETNAFRECLGEKDLSSKNMLLHLFEPDDFEAISSSKYKDRIVKSFSYLLEQNQTSKSVDDNIKDIREEITKLYSGFNQFFYDGFKYFFEDYDNKDTKELLNKFCYKKAVMLYGPPGTGKTYEANDLAQKLLGYKFSTALKKTPEKRLDILKEFFNKRNDQDKSNSNIFNLQFHINYTYDDFVAGMAFADGKSEVRKGFIFKVIERANELAKVSKELPVVVILDEINRTDISRVFGELFSAIEYRGKDICLSLKENDEFLKINIPENVYFIGTMNEIDFSLERIDFALRRRFIWELKTFNKTKLKDIIIKDYGLEISNDDNNTEKQLEFAGFNINDYCNLCQNVNNKIKSYEDKGLGEKYYIGHAFFAEITKIMKEMNYEYADAKNLLWEISIKPTIEAYCGSLDKSTANNIIKECGNAFEVNEVEGKEDPKPSGEGS